MGNNNIVVANWTLKTSAGPINLKLYTSTGRVIVACSLLLPSSFFFGKKHHFILHLADLIQKASHRRLIYDTVIPDRSIKSHTIVQCNDIFRSVGFIAHLYVTSLTVAGLFRQIYSKEFLSVLEWNILGFVTYWIIFLLHQLYYVHYLLYLYFFCFVLLLFNIISYSCSIFYLIFYFYKIDNIKITTIIITHWKIRLNIKISTMTITHCLIILLVCEFFTFIKEIRH